MQTLLDTGNCPYEAWNKFGKSGRKRAASDLYLLLHELRTGRGDASAVRSHFHPKWRVIHLRSQLH